MPKLGDLSSVDPEKEYKSRCNPDGSCSGCGECCSDFLPLSDDEVKRIRAYVKKRGLKPHHSSIALMTGANDITCPFRDNEKKLCDIYAIRPEICRSFICSKTFDEAQNDKKLLEKHRNPYSMRYAFFGECDNSEMLEQCISLIASYFAANRQR